MRYGTIAALGMMTAAERSVGRYMRAPDEHPAPTPPAPDPAPTPPAPDPAPTPPAPDPAPTPPTPDAPKSFEDAFAEHAKPDPLPDPVVVPPGGKKPAKAADPAPTPPAPDPAPTPPAPPASPAPAVPTAEEIVKGLTDLIGKPTPTPGPAPEPTPIYTPEEVALISTYEENWPDVAKAETLKRRAEYTDLLGYVFGEVAKRYDPLLTSVATIGNTLHTQEVKGQVTDYTPELEGQVTAWVDTQPSYLQEGMKRVMQEGTSEEVVDLIGRYRAAAGVAPAPTPAPPGPTPPAPPAPAAPGTELSEAAKQAAASLAPVSGDRSQAPAGDGSGDDFQTAFARFVADA